MHTFRALFLCVRRLQVVPIKAHHIHALVNDIFVSPCVLSIVFVSSLNAPVSTLCLDQRKKKFNFKKGEHDHGHTDPPQQPFFFPHGTLPPLEKESSVRFCYARRTPARMIGRQQLLQKDAMLHNRKAYIPVSKVYTGSATCGRIGAHHNCHDKVLLTDRTG